MIRNFKGEFHGLGTVGEKGQIVIPAPAREKLEIKCGEKFIFFAHGRILHMVKAHEFDAFLDRMTEKFTKNVSSMRDKVKRNLK